MAERAVLAELRFRDGRREKVRVQVEDNLSSLIRGVNEMNVNVSRLLGELVESEKVHGVCAQGEEDEDSEEEEEDDEDIQNSELQPPTKRSKS